jgi:hypothetical protein
MNKIEQISLEREKKPELFHGTKNNQYLLDYR